MANPSALLKAPRINMKTPLVLITMTFVTSTGISSGCAHASPKELVQARESYRRASTGPAAKSAPAELHVASVALAQAEQSFKIDWDGYRTRDLAYIAQRKALLAEATASISNEQDMQQSAVTEYETTQAAIMADTQDDLKKTRAVLDESQRTGNLTSEQLAAEQAARADAERQAAEALAALAKMVAVKDEPRGTVITLSGSVLFGSDRAILLPTALSRLDEVGEVLLSNKERKVVVEGHTDSRGSEEHNLDLSRRRADAVRNHLVQQGYEPDLIVALGLGEGQPVASNSNAEGRANNRRVEIVLTRP